MNRSQYHYFALKTKMDHCCSLMFFFLYVISLDLFWSGNQSKCCPINQKEQVFTYILYNVLSFGP